MSRLSGASGKLPVLASQRSRSSSPGFEGGRERLDTVEDDDDGGGYCLFILFCLRERLDTVEDDDDGGGYFLFILFCLERETRHS